MNEMKTIETWALHAYADGELDAAGRAEIERLLDDNPSARAELAIWQDQKAALKRAYDDVLDEPIPAGLTRAVNSRPLHRLGRWQAAAAAVALLLIGGAGGWFLSHQTLQPGMQDFADRALAAHIIYAAEVRHPVEVGADQKDHLQTWLSKRVGAQFVIPNLTPQGYTLLGGRLLVIDDRPAAQLMYEDSSKRRITLYLRTYPDHQEQAVRIENRGDLIACYWRDGGFGFVMAGELDRANMMTLAHAVYDELEKEG
jgi:anti-sigma factor RsiW